MQARRRPSAIKHDLSSAFAREEWSQPVLDLAGALLGSSPRGPCLLAAAREAAEAIIHLHRVQWWRLATLEGGGLARLSGSEDMQQKALALTAAVRFEAAEARPALYADLRAAFAAAGGEDVDQASAVAIYQELTKATDPLRRLLEHERKALSRRRKALRRLDYERIEAERRR